MASSLNCCNCLDTIQLIYAPKYPLKNKLPDKTFTCREALLNLYNLAWNPEPAPAEATLCVKCARALGNAYQAFLKFKECTKEGSLIQVTSAGPIPPANLPISPPRLPPVVVPRRTPVRRRLLHMHTKVSSTIILQNHVRLVVQREMLRLMSRSSLNVAKFSRDNWLPTQEVIAREVELHAPLIHSIMRGLLNKKSRINSFTLPMRSIIGIAMRARNQRANVFQKTVALHLFCGKASSKTYDTLHKLGISVPFKTVITTIDELRKDYDHEVLRWQKNATSKLTECKQRMEKRKWTTNEDPLPNLDDYMDIDDDTPEALPSSSNRKARKRLRFNDKDDDKMFYGGYFSMDNIDYQCTSTLNYNSTKKANAMHSTSFAFIKCRVGLPVEQVLLPRLIPKAVDVPMSAFIPSTEDWKTIRRDHVYLTKRLLVRYNKHFLSLRNDPSINWYIPHQYSEQSKKKSDYICLGLGIRDFNSGTTEGTKQCLKYMMQYYPRVDGTLKETMVSGDGSTCRLIKSTIRHHFNSDTLENNLEGTQVSVGGFHTRFVLLHDLVKNFCKRKAVGTPGVGTIPYFRFIFAHPSKLETDPKSNFCLGVKLMRMGLVAYVSSVAEETLGISDEKSSQAFIDLPPSDKLEVLNSTAEKIVNFEWHDFDRRVNQTKFCICNKEHSDEMLKERYVACENVNCRIYWFHVSCLRCPSNKIYRRPPVNSKLDKDPYYCSVDCEISKDKCLSYSKAFINAMLMFEGYRDAIRTNDGDRIDSYNKLQLLEYESQHHHIYSKIGHMQQLNKHGFADRDTQHNLRYNSTVNLTGERSNNISSDLFNEFYNRGLKDVVSFRDGNKTVTSIERRSQFFQISSQFQSDWGTNILDEDDQSFLAHNAKYEAWAVDVPKAIEIIRNPSNNLVKFCGDRFHEGFQNFSYEMFLLKDASVYKKKQEDRAKIIDRVERYAREKRSSVVTEDPAEAIIQSASSDSRSGSDMELE